MMILVSQIWTSVTHIKHLAQYLHKYLTNHSCCYSACSVAFSVWPCFVSKEIKISFSWPLGGESKPSIVIELNTTPNHPDLNSTDMQGGDNFFLFFLPLLQNFIRHERRIWRDVWGIPEEVTMKVLDFWCDSAFRHWISLKDGLRQITKKFTDFQHLPILHALIISFHLHFKQAPVQCSFLS